MRNDPVTNSHLGPGHWLASSFAPFVAWLLTASSILAAESVVIDEAPTIAAFALSDTAGNSVEVAVQDKARWTVVCFLGTECPLARHYGRRLSEMQKEFADRPVQFVGINSNSQDSPAEVAAFAREYGISFPLLKDPGNRIADQFGARMMSEVFVLDQKLAIRYRGRVDDQYAPGVARPQATRQDLRLALKELLAGQPVSIPQTEVTGCTIGRVKTPRPDATVTYCRQVIRILNDHCVECHRPGEIGPFALTDYDEVIGWGDTLVETLDSGRMPPWNADPAVGHFQNARVMPEADKQLLRDWVSSGMPYGDASELPPPREYSSGWNLPRPPDLVLKMRDRPYHVPATGSVEYQYFVVDPHFEEDRWVCASQIIPGSPSTVHHCIVFVRPPDGTSVRGVGYLTGYVPGQRNIQLHSGYARRVPAGSKLVFQMHYTPNGVEADDLTQLGMNFLPEAEVTHEMLTLLGIDQEFEIPPNAADHPVHARVNWIPKRAELLAIVPHMHVRGKSFVATARTGDAVQTLLSVPRYDFNWQHIYALETPLKLAEIDQLEFTAHFDNSKRNPANPDPTQTVTWGDQTWEEMAIAFFEVADPRHPDAEPEPMQSKQKLIVHTPDQPSANNAETVLKDFFARFDKNHDDAVLPEETPLGFRKFGFHQYDYNHDGKLTRDEIQSAAEFQQKKRKR